VQAINCGNVARPFYHYSKSFEYWLPPFESGFLGFTECPLLAQSGHWLIGRE
jgi:hypothetical protein